ncbi:MAG: C40 family peptidase [Bryobacterales bacterium]|nr:C40 family peptidase [Bryobacterales bacterium]
MPCPHQALRLRVIAEAHRLVLAGAHYLWGCQSQRGRYNGAGVHRIPNQMGADETGRFLFAYRHGNTGACAGRCGHPDVIHRRRYTATTLPALDVDQDRYAWPRYFTDPDPDPERRTPSALVYGESCVDKEHFDCAGFVRHCFDMGTGHPPGRMRDASDVIWTRGRSGAITSVDIYPGDLAYGNGGNHVGMLSGRAAYAAPSPDCSYHAFAARAGVIRVPIAQCNWIAEVRRWRGWDRLASAPAS